MGTTKYYYYDKTGNAIHRAIVHDNLIEQYEVKILTGYAKGHTFNACSFSSLLNNENFIFGELKTLKVLYVETKS